MTSQGHPRTLFRRALERGNVVAAEITARELGGLDLSDALELTALIALRDRDRGRRYAVRWLQRWLDETRPALDELGIVIAALQALGGTSHITALGVLRDRTKVGRQHDH